MPNVSTVSITVDNWGGAIHWMSYNIVHDELGCERVDDHKKTYGLLAFDKTIIQETPIYVQDIVPNCSAQNLY